MQNKFLHLTQFQWIVLVTFFSGFGWWIGFHDSELMQPDSAGYIDFSTQRTVGYPVFLWLHIQLFGTFKYIPISQLLMIMGATIFLARAFGTLTQFFWAPLVFVVASMINPTYTSIFYIMTEPLSISSIMVFLGVSIYYFRTPSSYLLIYLGLLGGGLILLRPAHYPFIIVVFLMCLYKNHLSLPKRLFTSLGPLGAVLLIGCSIQWVKNDIFRLEDFGGFNMIGKVAPIADSQIPSRHPELIQEMAIFANPIQQYVEKAPTLRIKAFILMPYYDTFRYQYLDTIRQKHPLLALNEQVFKETTLDIIKARPLAFLKDAWMHYEALWMVTALNTEREKEQLKAFIKASGPLPHQVSPYPHQHRNYPPIAWLFRISMFLVAFGGLLMIGTISWNSIRRKNTPPIILMGGLAALITQGQFMLTALTQAGLPRYGFALWPAIVFTGMIMFLWILNLKRSQS